MIRNYAPTRFGQMHYGAAGDPKKPAIILLPQAGRTSTMYRALAAKLCDEYRVYAIDYLGTGTSDPLPSGARIEDLADAAADFMDHLDVGSAYLYGHHAGNKVGAALAAGRPERIRKFVFAGQSHSIVPSNAHRSKTTATTRMKLLGPSDERETALVQWADLFSFVSTTWWRETLTRNIADSAVRAETIIKVVDELQAASGIPDFYRAIRSYDMERDLRRITVPTMILEIATPHEDQWVGRQGAALLATISGSVLTTVEEKDFHGITLEDKPDQLSGILKSFFR